MFSNATNKSDHFIAHGKVILSGEHSVVYGHPALVSTIDLLVQVSLTGKSNSENDFLKNIKKIFSDSFDIPLEQLNSEHFEIEGSLPIGVGLGSSAATAVAAFMVLADKYQVKLNRQKLLELVQQSEVFAHGNPSGVDAVATTLGGVYSFAKKDQELSFEQVSLPVFKNKWFLVQSGTPAESTKEMIELVKSKAEDPEVGRTLSRIGETSTKIISQVKAGVFPLQYLAENQRLLEELGVVGEKAKTIVAQIESLGGYAKITGAGGLKDGSGMILCYAENEEKLKEALKQRGYQYYQITFSHYD